MFNGYNYKAGDVTNNLKINACSGGIYKTYKESWFSRFNLKSSLAEKLLNNCAFSEIRTGEFYKAYSSWTEKIETDYSKPKHKNEELIVLQMVICGDMEVIAEIIKKEDFDKYFEKEKSE